VKYTMHLRRRMSDNRKLHVIYLFAFVSLLVLGFAIPARPPANSTDSAPNRTISAVSLNLAKVSDPDRIMRDIHLAPRLRNADVFLFQEVVHGESNPSVAEETARRLGYFCTFAAAAPDVRDQGLALVSRYPISEVRITRLKICDLGFRSRRRFAISAKVHTPWGDVRVWNVHLDTRVNAGERLEQLQPVIDDASQHTGPILIGGDFNTNELYWLRNMAPLPGGPSHSETIRAAMGRHGFQSALPRGLNTFPSFPRHLDWMFTRALTALNASTEPAAFSDHNAVWIRVRL